MSQCVEQAHVNSTSILHVPWYCGVYMLAIVFVSERYIYTRPECGKEKGQVHESTLPPLLLSAPSLFLPNLHKAEQSHTSLLKYTVK